MTRLAYDSTGSGPVLVLLHPVGLDRTFWSGLPEVLAERFKVLVPDLPGHGESPDCATYTRMDQYAADVIGFINDLGCEQVTLVGNSFGGMIAQEIAATRPTLVHRLVLCASPGLITGQLTEVSLARAKTAIEEGMEPLLDSTLSRWFTQGFQRSDTVYRVRERLLRDQPGNWAAAWVAMSTHDAQRRLAAATMPALVVAGGVDAATPLAMKMDLARALPDSRLVVLPDAPHMMQLERPQAFRRVLSDYLLQGWW